MTLRIPCAAMLIIFAACLHALRNEAVAQTPPLLPITSPTYVEMPPAPQEIITPPPGAGYVWIRGHFDRTPDSWNWVSGTWVQPPFSNGYYLPGYWQHQNGKFAWQAGHWAGAPQGVVVAKPVLPPPIYVEPAPPAPPAPNLIWQAGHWEWRGTWVWIPGQYIVVQSPQAVWVEGKWIAGGDGQNYWQPAHWENRS